MKDETFKIDGLKIIDFNKEGNAVRFFLGKKDCNDYWGDDWNDRPYEHNAGRVYGEFIEGYVDIGFDLDTLVLEPCSGYINSPFSKEDFKKRKVPVIITRKISENEWYYVPNYLNAIKSCDDKVYLGDDASVLYSLGEFLKVYLKSEAEEV